MRRVELTEGQAWTLKRGLVTSWSDMNETVYLEREEIGNASGLKDQEEGLLKGEEAPEAAVRSHKTRGRVSKLGAGLARGLNSVRETCIGETRRR